MRFADHGSPPRWKEKKLRWHRARALEAKATEPCQPNDAETTAPRIHYGKIASGNQVVKDGETRAKLADELGIICFEMEAAGLQDFPSLTIRGICDYSDSHKNKAWQKYSAAVAAAYAKELLSIIPVHQSWMDNGGTPLASETLLVKTRLPMWLASLEFEQIDSRQGTIEVAHSSTCEWLLRDPMYIKWLDESHFVNHHGFLWINGKPGAGKSTLMKYVYTNAKNKWKDAVNTTVIAFFFNARGVELEKSTEGMYRSLLFQLIQEFPGVVSAIDHLLRPRNGWDIKILQTVFTLAVTNLGKQNVICFIDALDECEDDQVQDMIEYFEDLGDKSFESETRLYTCFSSRHYPYIDIRNGLKFTLEGHPGHGEDLEKYVRSKLRAGEGEAYEEVSDEILGRASGVFLWVVLVVQILNREFRHGRMFAVRKRLRELPDGLGNLFKDIICRDNQNMDDLLLCIQWILYAVRPLTCEEYYFALVSGLDPTSENLVIWNRQSVTMETMELYLLSSSKGLAELDKSETRRTVQFIHESVRDFLVKENGISQLWPDISDDFESYSHDRLKHCCFNYLKVGISEINWKGEIFYLGLSLSTRFPFIEYATQNILFHANNAEACFPQIHFLEDFPLERWIELHNIYHFRLYTSKTTLLYILAEHNLALLIRTAVKSGHCPYVAEERHRYPFFIAIKHGHREALEALFDHDPSFSIDAGQLKNDKEVYEYDLTPLHYAVKHGLPFLVSHFISFAPQYVNMQDTRGCTPLSFAAFIGQEACSKVLLSSQTTSVNIKSKRGRSPLSFAAENGNEATAMLLLEIEGIDLNLRDVNGQSPLCFAAMNGHEAIVRLLLTSGASADLRDIYGRSPLAWAARYGWDKIVELLLATRVVDAHSCGNDGRSPVMLASMQGYRKIVELILQA